MSRVGTIILIIVLSIIAIGIGLFAFLFSIGKIQLNENYFNIFNRQSNTLIDSKEYNEIEDIYISTNRADVHIEYSTDKKYKVELYSDNEKNHSIDLSNKDLKIELEEKQNFGFFPKQARIIIYVPQEYKNVFNIETTTGDINAFAFNNASFKIKVTTGDVDIDKADSLDIVTSTGDITNNVVNTIKAVCTTGDIRLGDINNSIDLKTTTGDIRIDTIDLKESGNIQTTTGDVRISNKNNVYIETESKTGDVRIDNNADRMTELSLHIKVTTGDIRVG